MTGAPSGGQNSPEWETARRIEQFKFSIELFERNYAALDAFLQYLEAPIVAMIVARESERWRQHIAMREVVFLLHNYVASAQSLIDHARVLYQQFYQPQGLFPDYPAQAAGRFASNPLAQFVRMLRNMAQHYRLPSIQLTTQLQPGPLSSAIRAEWTLSVADLRQWSGWNPPAEQFLASAGERINIHDVVTDYHREIMEFYSWFQSRQAEIHGPLPQVFSTLLRSAYQTTPLGQKARSTRPWPRLKRSHPLRELSRTYTEHLPRR